MSVTFTKTTFSEFLLSLRKFYEEKQEQGVVFLYQKDKMEDIFDEFEKSMQNYYGADFKEKIYIRMNIEGRNYFIPSLDVVKDTTIRNLEHVLAASDFPCIEFYSMEVSF